MASYEGEQERRESLHKKCLEMAEGISTTSETLKGIAENEDYHTLIQQMLAFHSAVQAAIDDNILFLVMMDRQHHDDAKVAEHAWDGIEILEKMLSRGGDK